MIDLKNKVAVVTGAASGIGRALSHNLCRHGVKLALLDKDIEGLVETVKIIKRDKPDADVKVYQADISDKQFVKQVCDDIIKDFGIVDILINNAGVASSGLVKDIKLETFEWTININLWGVIYMTKTLLPHIIKSPEGSIVNVSSVFGLVGMPMQSAYCTSKFAVRGFTETLRMELYESNVAVTLVIPGGIKTNIARNSRSDYDVSARELEAHIKAEEDTFITTAERAADIIVEGMRKKSPRVLIGSDARKVDFLSRFFPNSYDKEILKEFSKTF